jgi:methylated-DNA-[protein]-cysteine S-methyltransferase
MIQGLSYVIFTVEVGWMGIIGSKEGLLRTTLPLLSEKDVYRRLENSLEGAKVSQSSFEYLIKRFRAYFSGEKVEFPDKLDLSSATDFQLEVWQATRSIPFGETRSYTWIARQIGKPKAVRAVGQALGKNPLPVIVPCHRVLASNGGMGGFSGGIETKRFLLSLEGAFVSE